MPKKSKKRSPSEQLALLKKVEALVKAGKSTKAAAKEIGVTEQTVYSWKRKFDSGTPKPKSRYNRKWKRQPEDPITIVTPNGYRIEGLNPTLCVQIISILKDK